MAATNLLFPEVRVELPGIPEPLLNIAIVSTLRDFLKRTQAYQVSLDAVDYTISDPSLDTDLTALIPADTFIANIAHVHYIPQKATLTFKTTDQLAVLDAEWLTKTGTVPKYWFMNTPGSCSVYPIAEATVAASIQVRVILNVDEGITAIPDWLYNTYKDELSNGLFARLYKIPGRDWTDQGTASYYKDVYENDIINVSSAVAASFGKPARQVMYGGI